MTRIRNISRTVKGRNTVDGAGVHLVRVLSHDDVKEIDPFLMLDAFDSTNPADYIKGFPLHPHRGIETFTYLVEGEINHKDTLGNSGKIVGGQAQWMNSGKGILHMEMPAVSPRLLGLQLWINLPKEHKMSEPTYRDVLPEHTPLVEEDDAVLRIVAGEYKGTKGVQGKYVQPQIYDIQIAPSGRHEIPTETSDTVFVYVLEGAGLFGESTEMVHGHTAALFGPGEFLSVKAGKSGVRFILFAGRPLKEPIAWAGPIVMNTQEELQKAFRELDAGTFIKMPQ